MAWASKIPAAVDALYTATKTAFAASPDLKTVNVLDGPVVSGSGKKHAFTVGHTTDDTGAVESTITPEGLAAGPDREHFTILCAAEVLAGSGTVSAARLRAYAIAAAAGEVIAADQQLAGTVMRAYVGTASLRQDRDPQGLMVTVLLAVECDAYTSR